MADLNTWNVGNSSVDDSVLQDITKQQRENYIKQKTMDQANIPWWKPGDPMPIMDFDEYKKNYNEMSNKNITNENKGLISDLWNGLAEYAQSIGKKIDDKLLNLNTNTIGVIMPILKKMGIIDENGKLTDNIKNRENVVDAVTSAAPYYNNQNNQVVTKGATSNNETYKPDTRELKDAKIYALPKDIQDYYLKLKMQTPTPEKLNLYKSPDSWTKVLTSALEGAVTAGKGYIQNNANDEQFKKIVAGLEQVTGKKYSKLTPEALAAKHDEFNNTLSERNRLGQKLNSKEVANALKQYEDNPINLTEIPANINDIVQTRMQYNQTNQDLNNIQNEVNKGSGYYDASAPDLATENKIKAFNEYTTGTLNTELEKNKAINIQKIAYALGVDNALLPNALQKIKAARTQNELDAITAQFMSSVMKQTK